MMLSSLTTTEVFTGIIFTAIYIGMVGSITSALADPKSKEDPTVKKINNSNFLSMFCVFIFPLIIISALVVCFFGGVWVCRMLW